MVGKMVFDKLKSFFGGEEEKVSVAEPDLEDESISIEEVRGKIENIKNNPLSELGEDYHSLSEKASNVGRKLEGLNKELEDAVPGEEVHPSIYKSAMDGKRFLAGAIDRAAEKIEFSSEPAWKDLVVLNRSLQDASTHLKNAMGSHGKQVARVFEDEMNRLKRLIDDLQSISNRLNTSLRGPKRKLDDLETIMRKKSDRNELLKRKKNLEKNLEELKIEKEKISERLEKEKSNLESLKKSRRFRELEEIKNRIEEFSRKKKKNSRRIESEISKLTRPLRKMSKMIDRNEHMVSSEVLEGINLYLKDPVQAALGEDKRLPKLTAVLQELKDVLERKMNLSEREREKRLEKLQDIIQNKKVRKLRKDHLQIEDRIKSLRKERKNSSLLEKKQKLEESIERKESKISEVKEKIKETETELEETSDQIEETNLELRKKNQ